MTGAGRSTAAKELEDLGYFVVDNLPPELVGDVVRLVDEKQGVEPAGGGRGRRARRVFFDALRAQLAAKFPTRRTTLLFLEAADDILVRRQEAARRPHPLQGGGRLLEGIKQERAVMASLRGDADLVIDTTSLNVHQLKDKVAKAFGTPETVKLRITVVSFGFKYGVPVDADLMADMRFLPNPTGCPSCVTGPARTPTSRRTSRTGGDAQEFLERYVPVIETVGAGYLREGKRFMTVAIGCTGGKHRSVAMTEEIVAPSARRRARGRGHPPRPRPGVSRVRWSTEPSVVALGGGHGLAASLTALRGVTTDLTAVVTVADNGGSSGRLREEFGVLPPGDLRMALAALCGDDRWGQTWARVLQHRFASEGEMDGHSMGNLLIVTLWDLLHDHVDGLDWVAGLLGARGRVLPMALTPLDITAEVRGAGTTRRGRHRPRARSRSRPRPARCSRRPRPEDAQACPQAVEAIGEADWVVLGPGSWYSSVIPHLLVPDLRDALCRTPGKVVVSMNLEPHTDETRGYDLADHLDVLLRHAPDLPLHAVLVDPTAVHDGDRLRATVEAAEHVW